MDKFAQISCNHSSLCYNNSIRSMTQCFGKVEKRRSKNIRFLNFIMQQTTAVDGVLRPQLLTYKDTCKYVCIGRTTLREMIKNKQFPSPRIYTGTNKTLFLKQDLDLWIGGFWRTGGTK